MPLYQPPSTAGGGTKELFIPLLEQMSSGSAGYDNAITDYPTNKLQSTENAAGVFLVPQDYSSTTSVQMVVFGDASASWTYTILTAATADGETATNSTNSSGSQNVSLIANTLKVVNITSYMPVGIAAGDYVTLRVSSSTSNVAQVLGFRFKYS